MDVRFESGNVMSSALIKSRTEALHVSGSLIYQELLWFLTLFQLSLFQTTPLVSALVFENLQTKHCSKMFSRKLTLD